MAIASRIAVAAATTTPARQVWTTADAAGGDGIAYWVEAICEAFLLMTADSRAGTAFTGALEQQAFGPLALNFIRADQQEVWRHRRDIGRSSENYFYLLHNRHGRLVVRQRGREALVPEGGCVLVDSKEPYYLSFPDGEACLSVQLPQAWLKTWLPAPEDAAARTWCSVSGGGGGGGGGWGGVLAQALANLQADATAALPLPAAVLADQFGALLALAAGAPTAARTPHRAALFARLQQALAERFHEPQLAPADVAAQHGISTRYLHLLFAESGSTFCHALAATRLERARRMLEDGRFARVPIGDIAWRCGFSDASHFARLFRRRFGRAPAAVRA